MTDIQWPPAPPGLDYRVEGDPPKWVLRLAERIGLFKRDAMNATEARRISEQCKPDPPVIDHWVTAIDKKIEAAARTGERKVKKPFHGYRTPLPDQETWKAVREHYESVGFTWREAPPPTSEESERYTEISW